MTNHLQLFSYRRCPFAIRVRMTMHEKELEFDVLEEDLKNKSAELLRLHPEGRVPLLIHDGLAIYESSVITEYVNENFDGINLMPATPQLRAKVRLWTVWCNHILKPEIDNLKYGKTEEAKAAAATTLNQQLQKFEDAVSSSIYLVGDSFSLADIHLFPFLRQMTLVKSDSISLINFPKTSAWFEKMLARPSFEKTMRK